ncbi:MAG TPA: protein translocase subunit SecF [Gemmatimonadales bacterium]|nr:protein translocase subunit SecF [Gemmatimonadales bacterium]
MLRLFSNAKYDFIGLRHYAYGLTAIILLPGLMFLALKGLNYSIEFTGGTLLQIQSKAPVDVAHVRTGLDRQGIHGAEIQNFGSENEYVIRARVAKPGSDANDTQATAQAVSQALDNVLGAGNYNVVRTEAVGPKVGGELRQKAFLAIFLSFFAVLAYLAYRFEWRFGLAAIIATAHDILATIAFIGVMQVEVSLTVVAAVLSMVGYSLNDTIIIFDRVRENLRKHKHESFEEILNRSVNETLPRSILTHGTTLATLLALTIFGGEVIRPFAVVMFFGVFVGTFSSIYIASPVLMAIEKRWPGPAARGHLAPKKAPSAAPSRKPQTVG